MVVVDVVALQRRSEVEADLDVGMKQDRDGAAVADRLRRGGGRSIGAPPAA